MKTPPGQQAAIIWKHATIASIYAMILKTITIICLTLIFGCHQPASKVDNVFIVPADSMLLPKMTGNQPPPPPVKEYYFPSNFIIDPGGHIYFYQQRIKSGWLCGTGMEWNTPPSFIDLQPKDIVEVPAENLEDFIKFNIQYLDNSDRQFAVASVTDTIASSGLAKIFLVFGDKANHISWTFRRTTQEENVVLQYKKSKEKDYHSDEIKWDSTKTLFPPNMENINFTPPKIGKE
ncbi:MAG: hypothetical protein JWR61_1923 [Ferruginibacter sp.]|uniref:hypothetical protein n=1 Tax=Ferruginibacter sp. TaxID=1940288 RepID=UPI00265B321F|nr:hypothetical protein [Ferruginibacter sp.]MDB5276968.1 hypothetical protein [Ferruginibacter sp.]